MKLLCRLLLALLLSTVLTASSCEPEGFKSESCLSRIRGGEGVTRETIRRTQPELEPAAS